MSGDEKVNYLRVGRMKDGHGIKGELFIVLFAGEADWLSQLKEIRLCQENGAAPPKIFPVKSVRAHKNGLIVKCTELKTRNEAEALKGLFLEIPETYLVAPPGEEPYLNEVLGFQVNDQRSGPIGPVVGFSNNGAQDLLVVRSSKGDFDIPFVEAFVVKIDYEGKTMDLDLPFGLLGEEDDSSISEDSGDEPGGRDDDESVTAG